MSQDSGVNDPFQVVVQGESELIEVHTTVMVDPLLASTMPTRPPITSGAVSTVPISRVATLFLRAVVEVVLMEGIILLMSRNVKEYDRK